MARSMVKVSDKERRSAMVVGMIEELNEKGLSRSRISKETRITYMTLQNWINGKHHPSVNNLQVIEKLHRRHVENDNQPREKTKKD